MKVILSFDDGRCDTYFNSFRIIKKYNLTASVHITTGFIDNTFKTDEFGVGMKPLTISEIKEMNEYGIDISSHGDKHVIEPSDYFISKNKIISWVSKNRIGFSVPNSSASKTQIDEFLKDTKYDPLYVRVGRNLKCKSFFNKARYVVYKMLKFQLAFNKFNKINLNTIDDKYFIKSCVIKAHTRAKSVINFIKKYHSNDYTFVLMLHSVCDDPSNQWEWSTKNFDTLCSSLKRMSDNKEIVVTNLFDNYGGRE